MIRKIVAVILNLVFLSFVIGIIQDEGFPEDVGGWFMAAAILACPVVNIIIIFSIKLPKLSDSWFSLYFKRKRLEEQQKIDALNKKSD